MNKEITSIETIEPKCIEMKEVTKKNKKKVTPQWLQNVRKEIKMTMKHSYEKDYPYLSNVTFNGKEVQIYTESGYVVNWYPKSTLRFKKLKKFSDKTRKSVEECMDTLNKTQVKIALGTTAVYSPLHDYYMHVFYIELAGVLFPVRSIQTGLKMLGVGENKKEVILTVIDDFLIIQNGYDCGAIVAGLTEGEGYEWAMKNHRNLKSEEWIFPELEKDVKNHLGE